MLATLHPTIRWQPPVLQVRYPTDRDLHLDGRGLIGRTRAAALEATANGTTTGRLARQLRISPASASEHATTLREAGLITTQRERNTVHHTITPLGIALLNQPGTSTR